MRKILIQVRNERVTLSLNFIIELNSWTIHCSCYTKCFRSAFVSLNELIMHVVLLFRIISNLYCQSWNSLIELWRFRSSRPEVFLIKGVLKICSKFIGEHPCRSVISKRLQSNFVEVTLRHGCSPVNLLHIFRAPFLKNTSGRLLLEVLRL